MTETPDTDKAAKRRTGRSPSYPFISVQKALDQVKSLHVKKGDYAAPLASAVSAWGYSPKSSGGRQTLATMKYYGLIDITGEGDARMIKVSDIARRILLDQREDQTEKRQLIRKVALTPAAHKALFEHYPNGLASDGSVGHFLVFDEHFNPEAAKELLVEYKETARFVGLYEPDNKLDKNYGLGDKGDAKIDPPAVKVGDKIQCTVGGVDTFRDGATVLGFSEDGQWVFTDQSEAGSPLKDVSVMESAVLEKPTAPPPAKPAHLMSATKQEEQPKAGTRKAVFPLDEGDVALIFPDGMSAEGLAELGAYLDIFLKKEAKKKPKGAAESDKPE